MQHDPRLAHGEVLRVGPPTSTELRDEFGSRVLAEEVVAARGEHIGRRLQQALAGIRDARRQELARKRENECRREIAHRVEETRQAMAVAHKGWERAKRDLTCEENRALRLADLTRKSPRVESGVQAYSARTPRPHRHAAHLKALHQKVTDAEQERDRRRLDWEAAKDVATRTPQLAGHDPELDAIHLRLARLEDERKSLAQQLDDLRQEAIRQARLVAATAYKATGRELTARRYDVIIIDEASMLTLPLAYFAAGLGDRSCILTGDWRSDRAKRHPGVRGMAGPRRLRRSRHSRRRRTAAPHPQSRQPARPIPDERAHLWAGQRRLLPRQPTCHIGLGPTAFALLAVSVGRGQPVAARHFRPDFMVREGWPGFPSQPHARSARVPVARTTCRGHPASSREPRPRPRLGCSVPGPGPPAGRRVAGHPGSGRGTVCKHRAQLSRR